MGKMAQGKIRIDNIVDIVDIDVQLVKIGITTDTPNHIEQTVLTIRARLEGCTFNGDERPWVDLRTTLEGWKKMNEAFALAVKSNQDKIRAKHPMSIKDRKERRGFLRRLSSDQNED